jgi:diamine N-acetyltransferase
MTAIKYLAGDEALLDGVEPLWNKLNQHHAAHSPYFADWFVHHTFAQRRAGLVDGTRTAVRVDLAQDAETGQAAGYCIASVNEAHIGEIDSLYVEPAYRHAGIGDRLMQRALAWLDEQGVTTKQLGVAVGNEQAFAFYARYGFFPRLTLLLQIPPKANP